MTESLPLNRIDRERLVHVYLRDVLHIYDRLPSSRILHIAPDEHITGFLSRSNVLEYVCGDKFTATSPALRAALNTA